MKFLMLFFISLLFYSFGLSQTDSSDYVLVVRLKTAKNQIKALESGGHHDLAKEKKLKTWGGNMEIRRAFQKYLGDKVFFIYSSNYKNLKEGETEGIFLGDSLVVDPSIQPDLSNYYVAFWGNSPGTGMSVIMLLDQEFKETEIWVRTFGITPANFSRIDPQVKKFCEKIQTKIPKYLQKKIKKKG